MKFIIENIWLIGLAVISGGALLFPVLMRRGAKVSLLEAVKLMNQPKSTVLDVREETEFNAGHIKNARHIPLSDLSKRLRELDKQKANPVLMVCGTGSRSASATALLTRAGFASVVSLEGGMSAWQTQGMPVVK